MQNLIHLCMFTLCVTEIHGTINLNIESLTLCSPLSKSKVKLGRANDSALVINQQRLNYHPFEWEKNFLCKFQVISKHKDGIFAVIQSLNFRKDEATGECIDYIQFERKHNVKSRKFCGKINARSDMEDEDLNLKYALNTFVDTEGETDVRIFVDKKPIDVDQELNIVFTTYRIYCQYSETDLQCSKNTCIYKELFDNKDVNCPFVGCVDEGGCDEKLIILTTQSVGNKVLIASISSLLLIFGIFICCVLVCKMHKILCWSANFANSQNDSRPTQATRIELNEAPTAPSQTRPTAPSSSEEDKDLPPSYDSLFPSR